MSTQAKLNVVCFKLQAERPGGGLVAVKSLSLRSMADWKQLELFEKEAKAMRQLSHNGIPAYIDYFEVDSDGDRGYFLVQVMLYLAHCCTSASGFAPCNVAYGSPSYHCRLIGQRQLVLKAAHVCYTCAVSTCIIAV